MEADWEIEIGPGAPLIDANWPGFVDLRFDPRLPSGTLLQRARNLAEAADLPALAETLVRLNSQHSPVWTSKCDVWLVDADEIDPYELDASPQEAQSAWACYIDLLPRSDQLWITPEMAAASCKALCARLHAIPLSACRACRIDLIVRLAVIAPDLQDHGVTAYLTACAATAAAAKQRLAQTLAAFADVLSPQSTVE